jgi:hypothetical protein
MLHIFSEHSVFYNGMFRHFRKTVSFIDEFDNTCWGQEMVQISHVHDFVLLFYYLFGDDFILLWYYQLS